MYSKVVLAASLASIAMAMPTSETAYTGDSGTFAMISSHSGDVNVHLRPVTASGQGFWLGKETASYCPESVDCAANPGKNTVIGVGSGSASMAVAVPGGQQIYIAPDGRLGYTIAHSAAVPEGAIRTGFEYKKATVQGGVGTFSAPGDGFVACPTGTEGEYQIFAAISKDLDFSKCTGVGLATNDGVAADTWEYT